MYNKAIQSIRPLGFTWETKDPFLFCVHHEDAYPMGNEKMGPAVSLSGRNLGQDFDPQDGWRMYHGRNVPGFPMHPHRGFETVTVVLEGFVDHSDSHGASGRYGNGDVQWMTAGAGLQHAEMFPLLNKEQENPLHLFQIWLNLPQAKKFAKPHYKMLWANMIPSVKVDNDHGKSTEIIIIAGQIGDVKAPQPAPDSWAADPDNEVAIWIIKMAANTRWTLPPAAQPLNRTLYFFEGSSIKAAGSDIQSNMAIDLLVDQDFVLENGDKDAQFLLLQGRPIAEQVVQYGPFVMNTQTEIRQAFEDYRKDQFGKWPWDRTDPVHPRSVERFARYADGREEVRHNNGCKPGSITSEKGEDK
jgi:redox-sensitive bicupin YhaK (pirin superfamily)